MTTRRGLFRSSKLALVTCLIVVTSASQAICLNPMGCEPKTLDECLADATKRSTDAGVRLAERQCRDRFDRIKAEAVQREAEAFAKRWSEVRTSPRIAQYLLRLGDPTSITHGTQCGIKSPAGEKCVTYQWLDRRSEKTCFRKIEVSPYVDITRCSFQVQALESDPEKKAWAVWEESL